MTNRTAKRTGKRVATPDGGYVVAGKAANGAGSAYWVEDRKRWKATYRDARGKLRTVSGKTKTEAVERRDAKLAEVDAGTKDGPLGGDPTVAELVDYWLDYVADVRPTTRISYEAHAKHIRRGLGEVRVRDLTLDRVRRFLAEMVQDYSPDTVRNVRARLRQVAEEAIELGYLRTNPVTKAQAPRPKVTNPRGPKRVLTPEECQRLVAACDGHRLGAAVAILFLMGNRSSEVLGLAWSDIDFDAATATVRRGSTFLGGGGGQMLAPPKTAGTAGVHHLPPTVVGLLRQRRRTQLVERLEAGPLWQTITYEGVELDMVFTNATGGLALSQGLYTAVRDVCALAGVDPEGVGTHTGRRSVVTALYGAGLDLDDVARHVGHAATRTTAGYVQDLGQRPEATARRAAELLDPKANDA